MNRHTCLSSCVLALGWLLTSCRFDPRVPEASVTCLQDDGCPAGYSCRYLDRGAALGVCCRDQSCGLGLPSVDSPGVGPAPGPLSPVDTLVSCREGYNVIPLAASEMIACTISIRDETTSLNLDVIARNDPVALRSVSSCSANIPVAAEAIDPNTRASRPLSRPVLDTLVRVATRMKQHCQEARGVMVGAVADSWARPLPNAQELVNRFRVESQLALQIPTDQEELVQLYVGLSRNRRGRLVVQDRPTLRLLFWPQNAPDLRVVTLPITYGQAGELYLAGVTFSDLAAARAGLRARLQNDLRGPLAEIAVHFQQKALSPAVPVGRSDATLPLAVRGKLQDASRVWFDPDRYQATVDGATPALTSFGIDFGTLRAPELEGFLAAITPPEFAQLRTDPIRSDQTGGYGEYVILSTAVLQLLAQSVPITEFGFPKTAFHHGYLLQQLMPAPAVD
jgi:hypothetical protein